LASGNYFIGFYTTGFGPQYEYNSSGVATQGTSTTVNTTTMGNLNLAGTLTLNPSAQVGIGSTVPQYALDVVGTAQVNGIWGQADTATPGTVPANAYTTFGQNFSTVNGLANGSGWFGTTVSATGQYMAVCIAGSSGTLWYSTNYGQTWSQATTGLPTNTNYGVVAMSGNGQYLVMGISSASSALYVSSSYGASWSSTGVTSGSSNSYWAHPALSYNGQYQYVSQSGSSGLIYSSTNYGQTWLQTTAPAGSWNALACSANGQYVIAGLFPGYLYYSNNYGQTWTQTAISNNWNGVCCSASGQYMTAVVSTGSNGIYFSNNYGVNWTATSQNVANWSSVTCSASGQYQMATVYTGNMYYSTNFGISWTQTPFFTGTWTGISMSQNGLYTLACINGGAVYLSTLQNVGLLTNGRISIGSTMPTTFLSIGSNGGVNQSGNIPGISMTSSSGQNMAFSVGQGSSGTTNLLMAWTYNATPSLGYGQLSCYGGYNPLILQAGGGNVGFGTTTPGQVVDAMGAVRSNTLSNNASIILTSTYGAFGCIEAYAYNSFTTKLPVCINAYGGNVGINKTAPYTVLDISGTLSVNNGAAATSTGQYQGFQMYYTGTGSTGYGSIVATNPGSTYNPICLNPSGGSIGIGLTNPSYPLHVVGSTSISTPAYFALTNTGGGATGSSDTTFAQLTLGANYGPWIVATQAANHYTDAIRLDLCTNLGANNQTIVPRISIPGGAGPGAGNVGIGTTMPSAPLHIVGSGGNGSPLRLVSNTSGIEVGIGIYRNPDQSFPSTGDQWVIGMNSWGAGDRNIGFGCNNTSSVLTLNANGTVNIRAYTTNGTVTTINSTGLLSVSSDRRIKENITYVSDTSSALTHVLNLKPATYNMIGASETYLGFIAQDVEQEIPLAVDGKKYEWQWELTEDGTPKFDDAGNIIYKVDENGQKIIRPRGVHDRALIATQTLAIQELSNLITSQATQINQLQTANAALESQLTTILARLTAANL